MSSYNDISFVATLPDEISEMGQGCPICETRDQVGETVLIARIVRNGLIRDERDTLGYTYRCSRGHRFRVMIEPDRKRDE